jgi:3-hydroxybutyryl-CoA dehydrogenase
MNWITPFSVHIGVAGAGTMGSGITLTALLADLPVSLYDVSSDMLQRAQTYLESQLERKHKQQNLILLRLANKLEDLSSVKIVIEAIPENLELKQELFRNLESICPPSTILATNTSTLAVTALAAAITHPQRVAGMHFFNPAPAMPLVELVRGAQTSEETLQTLRILTEKLGKIAVLAADTPGFIVNRVARRFFVV